LSIDCDFFILSVIDYKLTKSTRAVFSSRHVFHARFQLGYRVLSLHYQWPVLGYLACERQGVLVSDGFGVERLTLRAGIREELLSITRLRTLARRSLQHLSLRLGLSLHQTLLSNSLG